MGVVYVGGAPGLVMGPCIVEIDRIVIREVQYQFEVKSGYRSMSLLLKLDRQQIKLEMARQGSTRIPTPNV